MRKEELKYEQFLDIIDKYECKRGEIDSYNVLIDYVLIYFIFYF